MILEYQEHGTSSALMKTSCWWHESWNLCQMIRQKSREKAETPNLPYTKPFSCDLNLHLKTRISFFGEGPN